MLLHATSLSPSVRCGRRRWSKTHPLLSQKKVCRMRFYCKYLVLFSHNREATIMPSQIFCFSVCSVGSDTYSLLSGSSPDEAEAEPVYRTGRHS